MKTSIDPTVILVSTKIDDVVIDRFDPEAKNGESGSGDNDQFRLPFLLDVRPPSEFYYDAAKSKLMTLKLGEDEGTQVSFNVPGDHLGGYDDDAHGQQGRLLRLAGWVDMDSHTTVSKSSGYSSSADIGNRLDVQERFFHIYSADVLLHICQAMMPHI